jgi:predicted MFS family arabinose efflux permease
VVDDVVPAGSANEAFGWLTGMAWVGAAVGAVIAGQLVDSSGPEAGIAGAAVAAALAFGVSVVGRRQLALRLSPEPS